MTGLEAMAAWLGRRTHGEEWADLDARTRNSMMEDARELLALYEAKRWRVPTTEWGDGVRYFMIWSVDGGRWIGPGVFELDAKLENPSVAFMIADPLPLPPAPGGGEGVTEDEATRRLK